MCLGLSLFQCCLQWLLSLHSRPGPFSSNRYGASVPIPVPTQVHNYQRIEQNLQSPTQHQTARLVSLTLVRVMPQLSCVQSWSL